MDEDDHQLSATADQFAETRAYDFLKHLTTLSIISIGGILGLLQNDSVDFPDQTIMVSIGAIGLAAITSLIVNGTLVGEPLSGKPAGKYSLTPKRLYYLQSIAVLMFLFGAGVFTGAFSLALT